MPLAESFIIAHIIMQLSDNAGKVLAVTKNNQTKKQKIKTNKQK